MNLSDHWVQWGAAEQSQAVIVSLLNRRRQSHIESAPFEGAVGLLKSGPRDWLPGGFFPKDDFVPIVQVSQETVLLVIASIEADFFGRHDRIFSLRSFCWSEGTMGILRKLSRTYAKILKGAERRLQEP